MNTDIEELLRDGMEHFTAGIRAPAALAHEAGGLRRRRTVARVTVACGTAAVTAAAVIAVATGGGQHTPGGTAVTQTQTVAYVVGQVKNALASENLVFKGNTTGTGGPSVTWAYGQRSQYQEYTGTRCEQVLANGVCTGHGASELYLADGTALQHGKLVDAYVTYFDHKYSLSAVQAQPSSACSATAALELGGPPIPASHWSSFIKATLDCGAASATGHVRIDGMETTKITGKPVTVSLSPGYAKVVKEKQARAEWTLYVNPVSYLPVRMVGSTQTFGGSASGTSFTSVTNVQWLPRTAANIARTLLVIPPGYHQVSSPADQ